MWDLPYLRCRSRRCSLSPCSHRWSDSSPRSSRRGACTAGWYTEVRRPGSTWPPPAPPGRRPARPGPPSARWGPGPGGSPHSRTSAGPTRARAAGGTQPPGSGPPHRPPAPPAGQAGRWRRAPGRTHCARPRLSSPPHCYDPSWPCAAGRQWPAHCWLWPWPPQSQGRALSTCNRPGPPSRRNPRCSRRRRCTWATHWALWCGTGTLLSRYARPASRAPWWRILGRWRWRAGIAPSRHTCWKARRHGWSTGCGCYEPGRSGPNWCCPPCRPPGEEKRKK